MAEVVRRAPLPREIIDVDLLDDEELARSTANLRRQQRHWSQEIVMQSSRRAGPSNAQHPIIVLDSDDDVQVTPVSQRSRRAGFRSPPPPPRGVSPIPPVPSFRPRHLSQRRSNRNHRAPVIPSDEPFAFEANLGQSSRHRRSPPPPAIPPPRGAPPSHHQPSMGFGGAFLAFARQDTAEGRRRQQQQQPTSIRSRLFGNVAGFLAEALGIGAPTRNYLEERNPEVGRSHRQPNYHWQDWPLAGVDLPMEFYQSLGAHPKVPEKMWKPSYTHPGKLPLGFTNDFEDQPSTSSGSGTSRPDAIVILDDDDEEMAASGVSNAAGSNATATSALVCAKCMEPLVLESGGASAATEEEKRSLRVWALRCGHMLDGRCIHTIMRPRSTAPVQGEKRKADEPQDSGRHKVRVTHDRKGKAKAVTVDTPPSAPTPAPSADDTSIRSRLRPRNLARTETLLYSSAAPEYHPTRRSAATKVKGKGRARKPVVLEDHQWMCPVAGCGRIHRSVRMSDGNENVLGGWSMDPQQGAIAMFV